MTSHPSHRAVSRGLAWSVPALVVGAAAPAIAASTCVDSPVLIQNPA
ncbi:hypothetical protein [Actinomyces vulturis]|nr:hypothetical protein [Actinomyces vulturis]